MQHAKRMYRIILSHVVLPAVPNFSALSNKRRDFQKKKLLNINYVLNFLYNMSGIFIILRRIQRDITINVRSSSCTIPVILRF
jgi:hypothetical protein